MTDNKFISVQSYHNDFISVHFVPSIPEPIHQTKNEPTTLKSKWKTLNKLEFFGHILMAMLCLVPEYLLLSLQKILEGRLQFSPTTAASIVNAHDGFIGIFGIVGAIAVDSYLTHYGMMIISSIFYSIGLVLLTIGWFSLHQNDSADIVMVRQLILCGLIPIAIAKFSLRNSINALLSTNVKENTKNAILYTVQIIITIIFTIPRTSAAEVKRVETPTTGPRVGATRREFVSSSIAMVLVFGLSFVYIISKSIAKPMEDRQNPLKNMVRVFFAAIKKRHLRTPEAYELYEPKPEPKDRMKHTTQHNWLLGFLDKAAVLKETDNHAEERENWLCTVTEVEETKCMIRMFPVCTTFLAYGMVRSIGYTFFWKQETNMRSWYGKNDTEIPLQVFYVLATVVKSLTTILYKVLILKKLPGKGKMFSPAIEYAMGMVLLSLCCTMASWVEMETYESLFEEYWISIFWLIPQFVVFGAMEALAGDGIQNFYSGQLPPSMKRYAQVLADGITSAGSFLAIFLVWITKDATKWFEQDEEGDFKLYKFYHLCTVVGISIFFAYAWAAVRYHYRDSEEEDVNKEENELGIMVKDPAQNMAYHRLV